MISDIPVLKPIDTTELQDAIHRAERMAQGYEPWTEEEIQEVLENEWQNTMMDVGGNR